MKTKMSESERRLRSAGKWFVTPFFAIGSGLITTVAVASISVIAGLALWWLIPILGFVFLAETAVSIYLFKDSVPDTLAAIFIDGIFKDLSTIKKCILSIGIFAALGGGMALGALTYTSGVTAITAVLGLASLSCPPLAIALASALAIVGFIAFSCLLVKWISTAIKTDMHMQVIDYFKNMFTRDESKSLAQQILENAFKIIFTTTIILISIVGTIATLGTMQKGLINFLGLIPAANMLAVKISSGVIAYGMMGVARLPWALQSVCGVFSQLGEMLGRGIYNLGCKIGVAVGVYSPEVSTSIDLDENIESNNDLKTIGIIALKTTAAIVHCLSFGALAKDGGGRVLTDVMSQLHLPASSAALDTAGQVASMASGSAMSLGIAGYSLFAKPDHHHKNETQEVVDATSNKISR